MENIVGDCLDSCWASLDTEAKSAVVDQLRICFTQLRQIPSPGYFGLVGRRPYITHIFWVNNDAERRMVTGPFDSEEQMLKAFIRKYEYNLPKHRKHEYYIRSFPCVLRDHAPVFTHGGLQRKNVMVKKDEIVVIIDWESAGWFPRFWEYAMAMFACR
jgi:aminoglycoside phosphotransferase (APT) family kinase protein